MKSNYLCDTTDFAAWNNQYLRAIDTKGRELYAKLRRLSMFRDQLNEDRIRFLTRLHREMKIYFRIIRMRLEKSMVHLA